MQITHLLHTIHTVRTGPRLLTCVRTRGDTRGPSCPVQERADKSERVRSNSHCSQRAQTETPPSGLARCSHAARKSTRLAIACGSRSHAAAAHSRARAHLRARAHSRCHSVAARLRSHARAHSGARPPLARSPAARSPAARSPACPITARSPTARSPTARSPATRPPARRTPASLRHSRAARSRWPRSARSAQEARSVGSVSTGTRLSLRGEHGIMCCERRAAARTRRENAGQPGCRHAAAGRARLHAGQQASAARARWRLGAHPRLSGR